METKYKWTRSLKGHERNGHLICDLVERGQVFKCLKWALRNLMAKTMSFKGPWVAQWVN